jgi:hypothetical protein
MKNVLVSIGLVSALVLTGCNTLCESEAEQAKRKEYSKWLRQAWEAEKAGTPWAGVTIPADYRLGFETTVYE